MNNILTIAGRTLTFEVVYGDNSEYGGYNKTLFYQGTKTITLKKWRFLGDRITKEIPKYVFSIDEAITDPNLSKEWWVKELIEKIKILGREEEIERGEFI